MADTRTISVNGMEFEVNTPYAEGHTCTAAEAKTLNQSRCENIANNMRKRVKEAQTAGTDEAIDAIREAFAKVNAEYEFSLASTGGSRSAMTPHEKEVARLAKAQLGVLLKNADKTFKSYTEEHGKEYVAAKLAEIGENEQIQKLAKKNVADAAKMAEGLADLSV